MLILFYVIDIILKRIGNKMNNVRGKHIMTHEQIWNAIDLFAHEHNMSCSGLAKCSGLDPTTFNKSKRLTIFGQPRWPSTGTISKILSSTHASAQDFFKFITDADEKSNDNE